MDIYKRIKELGFELPQPLRRAESISLLSSPGIFVYFRTGSDEKRAACSNRKSRGRTYH